MKPGDLIEWIYVSKYPLERGDVIVEDDKIWSMSMGAWIPVGDTALLVGYADKIMTWVSAHGLFHAQTHDESVNEAMSLWKPSENASRRVVARVCNRYTRV